MAARGAPGSDFRECRCRSAKGKFPGVARRADTQMHPLVFCSALSVAHSSLILITMPFLSIDCSTFFSPPPSCSLALRRAKFRVVAGKCVTRVKPDNIITVDELKRAASVAEQEQMKTIKFHDIIRSHLGRRNLLSGRVPSTSLSRRRRGESSNEKGINCSAVRH